MRFSDPIRTGVFKKEHFLYACLAAQGALDPLELRLPSLKNS